MGITEDIIKLVLEKRKDIKGILPKKTWKKIVIFVTFVIVGLGVIGLLLRNQLMITIEKIFPPTFENVAGIVVLRFEGDSPDNALQRDLISTLNGELSKQELEKRIVVWESSETVTEAEGLTKAHQNARKIGKKHNACLVIWGNRIEENKIHQRLTIVNDKLRTFVGGERTFVAQTIKELRLPSELIDKPIQLTNFIAGFSLFEQKDHSSALNYFKRAIEYSAEDSTNQSDIRFYTGTSHLFLAQGKKEMGWHLREAMIHYEKAAKFYAKKDSLIRHASTLNNLGIIYAQLPPNDRKQNLKKAIALLDSALQIFTEENITLNRFEVQNNLGVAFAELYIEDPKKEPQKALDLFEAVLDFDVKKNYPILFAVIHNNLGSVYSNLAIYQNGDNLKKAIFSYNVSLTIFDEKNFPLTWALVQKNLGLAYLKQSDSDSTNNIEKAVTAFKSALRVFTKENHPYYWEMIQYKLGETLSYSNKTSEGWVRHYAYSYDEAIDAVVDSKGNIYVTGYCSSYKSGYDYLTIKYDMSGKQIWASRFNSKEKADDKASAIIADKIGNIYVTGTSGTIKYDYLGNEKWVSGNYSNKNNFFYPTKIAIDQNGYIYVMGITSNSTYKDNYKIIKYNDQGREEWYIICMGGEQIGHNRGFDCQGQSYSPLSGQTYSPPAKVV